MGDSALAPRPPSPATLTIDTDTVHVWRCELDRPSREVDDLSRHLSDDEAARAGRFRRAKHRDRYTVGRGVLRVLLGRYLNTRYGDLRFTYNDRGKPELSGVDLRFNVAHSGGIALFAVTRAAAVGIDIEWVRPDIPDYNIAELALAPEELDALRSLEPTARREAFFRYWTCKEAYVKACGGGLSSTLDRIVVSLAADEAPRLLEIKDHRDEAEEWSLHELHPTPRHVAALAVRRPEVDLEYRDFKDGSSPESLAGQAQNGGRLGGSFEFELQ